MAKRSVGNTGKKAKTVTATKSHQQGGRQQGHNTGKQAWKSNLEHVDTQPGTGQAGQHPREGEPFGSTPGEVRGHAGGKRGQAMGGQRGTAKGSKRGKVKGKTVTAKSAERGAAKGGKPGTVESSRAKPRSGVKGAARK